MIVRVHHIRAARLCMRGARNWFAQHGLDWNDFLTNGLPADAVRALNDPFADRTLAAAEAENGKAD